MEDVVVPTATKRAERRSRSADPLAVRFEKGAVSVASKAREVTTDRAREGQLLRCYFGDLS